MPVQSVEKYKVRGITVRLRRLGQHRVELLVSDRDTEFRRKLLKAISGTKYARQTQQTKRNNLTCRLLPTDGGMSFNQLIEKVVNLTAARIERHEKKQASSHQSESSGQKKRGAKRYHNDPALAVTA